MEGLNVAKNNPLLGNERMDKDEIKSWAFILFILLVGIFPSLSFILVWYVTNVMSPIGKIEDIAWALSSPDPWVQVSRLTMLIILGAITTIVIAKVMKVIATAIERIREKVGL